jgi:[ribosomal protein S5]-alanine N-acetyltransferase
VRTSNAPVPRAIRTRSWRTIARIGRIGLYGFRARDRIAALYMYIGEPDCWGKGFGRDAVVALIRFAFDRWDLARVELWALGDNDHALALYRACGFVADATLPERSFKDGRWVDRVVMSVTRDGFAQVAGPADPRSEISGPGRNAL